MAIRRPGDDPPARSSPGTGRHHPGGGSGKRPQSGSTRTRLLCPECNAENFINLSKLDADEVLCPCGQKIDVSLIKYSLTSSTEPKQAGGYPRMLGRYKLIKKLGSGGQAEVHLGVDTLDRKVAVKEYSGVAEEWKQAHNEASCSMRCSGLNIVNTYDILEEERTIVQEYVEGETLRKVINARAADARNRGATLFPVDQVVDVMSGVLQGLRVCHVRGVIHLDIKPENIMIDSTSGIRIPKLFDFGLAHNLLEEGDRLASGEMVLARRGGDISFQGTPAYAAPEQIDPKRKHMISARTDIYQCGVMFYELLTGRTPHEGSGWEEIFRSILAGNPVSLRDSISNLPEELVAVQAKLCAHDTEKRYASAQEVIDDLERWRVNRAIAAYRTANRRGQFVKGALLLAIGLGAGFAAGFIPSYQDHVARWSGRIGNEQVTAAAVPIMEQRDRAVTEMKESGSNPQQVMLSLQRAEEMLAVLQALVPDAPATRNVRDYIEEGRSEIENGLGRNRTQDK